MITDKENIVWHSKVIRQILFILNKKIDYPSNVAKKMESNISNTLLKFKELRKEGLIELVKNKGRKKPPYFYQTKRTNYYELTEKGNRIVGLLFKINEELK